MAEQHGAKVVSVLEGGYSLTAPASDSKRPARGRPKASSKDCLGGGGSGGWGGGDEGLDPATMFSQQSGDGGLVKGVLAHVAALAGRPSWI